MFRQVRRPEPVHETAIRENGVAAYQPDVRFRIAHRNGFCGHASPSEDSDHRMSLVVWASNHNLHGTNCRQFQRIGNSWAATYGYPSTVSRECFSSSLRQAPALKIQLRHDGLGIAGLQRQAHSVGYQRHRWSNPNESGGHCRALVFWNTAEDAQGITGEDGCAMSAVQNQLVDTHVIAGNGCLVRDVLVETDQASAIDLDDFDRI
jgi:hypothetical protein